MVSGGKEAAGEEEEQEEEGSNEDRTSIILIWPTGSYVATFGCVVVVRRGATSHGRAGEVPSHAQAIL